MPVLFRRGGGRTNWFHRLGIALAILGMVQSFAPASFQPARGSLRLMSRLKISLSFLAQLDSLALAESPLVSAVEQDQEPGQESQDTEDASESFSWPEALSDRLSVQRAGLTRSLAAQLKPETAADRTRSSLQTLRALPIRAALSASATERLCRFTC
jgi:hypothetical protein